ncbi:MAG TPA: hypothetical protein VGN33_08155 [Leifsonia sp.]|jgi:hypothetical protein|nr:hypothetical protein [Leifsonia sp.]
MCSQKASNEGPPVGPDPGGAVSAEYRATPTTVAAENTKSPRTTITFYLTEALRNRARATYRATSFLEKDTSWSEMLNKALLAEVQRREREHNADQLFKANGDALTPGRPIGF